MAFRRGGTLHWLGSDHLGSTLRVLDSSFTALDGMRYKPYGEDRDTGSSLNTDRKFTGQTEDEAAGLYWYASRAYDAAIGRFVSPDSIVPAPGNPQSLNRYSYVYNNPLKYVDPSGHSAEWFNEDWEEDFREKHGREPNGMDIAYRYASMDATSRGDDWSVENWAGLLNSAKESIGHAIAGGWTQFVKWSTGAEAVGTSIAYGILNQADESQANAVRHAYWNARGTSVAGGDVTQQYAYAHEQWNMRRGQAEIDLEMDLYNNAVGRKIGGKRWTALSVAEPWPFVMYRTIREAEEGRLVKIVDDDHVQTTSTSFILVSLAEDTWNWTRNMIGGFFGSD